MSSYLDAVTFDSAASPPPPPPHCAWPPSPAQLAYSLILASHQSLSRIDLSTGCISEMSSGHGHYYGVVSADVSQDRSLLLVGSQARLATGHARNASGGFPNASDGVLLVHAEQRRVLCGWTLPTDYLHDMLRADDGSYFAIDTTDGVVWRLQLEQEPPSKRVQRRDAAEDVLLRRIRVLGRYSSIEASAPPSAARTAHANSALVALGHLWVLHNNLRRRSQLVLIDLSSGKRHPTAIPLGGPNCHSAVFHRGDVLYLNSSIGGLARLRADGSQQSLWQAGPQKFAKGLAVVDDVAYFGVSDRSSAIARNWAQVDLVAVHVAPSGAGRWLWTRRLPSTGLVNSVSAPHVAPHGCTWRACSTRARWSTGSSTQAGSDGSEGAADTADDDGKAHLPRREQWARILGLPAHEPHAGIVAAPLTALQGVTSRFG